MTDRIDEIREFAEDLVYDLKTDLEKEKALEKRKPLQGLYSKPPRPASQRKKYVVTGTGSYWEISDGHDNHKTVRIFTSEDEYNQCLNGIKLINAKRKREVDPMTLTNIMSIKGLGLDLKDVMKHYYIFKNLFYYFARDRAVEVAKQMNV